MDGDPVRACLIPARGLDGHATLEVDQTENVAPPSSIPLTMVANLRSAYNKEKNIRQTIHTLGLDLLIASETWERPHKELGELLASPHYSILSYCRGREAPATRLDGKHAGKSYPGKTGGGTAIIYNHQTFQAIDTEIGVPAGVEAKWCVLAPRRLEEQVQVERICVGSIYIAPRSPYKKESISHIIHTIHLMKAKYDNNVHFLIAGNFNRVDITEVLDSYGALQQICGVSTRQGAALQLVLTDLHTFLHPATALPPLQVDEEKQGRDGDHQALILAAKANKKYFKQREKRRVKTRPMPESGIKDFCAELTKNRWMDLKAEENVNEKVEMFHNHITTLLNKHLPEKIVTMSSLDKKWMTPDLKQLLRQVQRERLLKGKSLKFKKLWSKFRRLKRSKIKSNTKEVVEELKEAAPGKWYQIMKKMGGVDQSAPRLEIEELKRLTDQESAEAVAQSFAMVSQEYEPLDPSKLPAFLPAGKPEQLNEIQVFHQIQKMKKTKSTLPIDIPDKLRKECALDLAEPMTDIMNSCLRAGRFPVPWRREWVTPVPKTGSHQPKTMKEVRKIASTSDYSKVFEVFLRKWILEDIDDQIHINQFAGRKGTGTEHLMVMMMDRILKLLDTPGASAIIMSAIDWKGAFDRLDPTITVTKLIKMGVRSSIVPIIIEYLQDRKMTVRYNHAWSKWYSLVGGGPQGSWLGQNCYIAASDDAASWVDDEDKYKFCDDLSILDLVMIGGILTDYNFYEHVASDVGVDEKFLKPEHYHTQHNLQMLANWTNENLMQLNESKTTYMVFSRARKAFATRLTLNSKLLERTKSIKLLGMWLQEDAGWETNTQELCKKAYTRVAMLTKLRYAGVNVDDLITIYKTFIRSTLEYNSVVFHSSLHSQQEEALERCQSVCLKVILQESYVSYRAALEMSGLETLKARREARCIDFCLKSIKHKTNKRMFPLNQSTNHIMEVRSREKFKVNFAHTNTYRDSTIPYCQRLLNRLDEKKEEERREEQEQEEEEEEEEMEEEEG